MLNRSKINSTGHLTHMIAKDLFTETKKQVFSAKSGKWLGTIDTAGQLNFEPENEPEETIIQEPVNPIDVEDIKEITPDQKKALRESTTNLSAIHWLPENIQQATEYIAEYCPDLELTEL